ncbi:LysM peptidoglycan-binding domain-containing protein [Anaerotignum sp.]|uniref:LysM peptidoglycan-binding domain-containing protein n=1 Tax=Anaerotignum sp. TaxID=2039241 RepID=UPI002714BED3|nr:LysM peptidoglycan-binding domain-containing protein [Anaerotignum sp.]
MGKYIEKELVKMSQAIREKVFLLLVLGFIIGVGTFAMGAQSMREMEVYYECVLIHSGDTLWGIAQEYKGESQDIEHMVYDIMKVNGMCSENIKAGESLIVPVKKGKI